MNAYDYRQCIIQQFCRLISKASNGLVERWLHSKWTVITHPVLFIYVSLIEANLLSFAGIEVYLLKEFSEEVYSVSVQMTNFCLA